MANIVNIIIIKKTKGGQSLFRINGIKSDWNPPTSRATRTMNGTTLYVRLLLRLWSSLAAQD